MFTLQEMSDLHLEFHRDQGDSFISSIDFTKTDVLVLAGDINTVAGGLEFSLIKFCSKVKHVVYVPGNHEYYHSSREQVWLVLDRVKRKCSNFHWLENSFCVIGGQRFIGSTLWFRERPDNFLYQYNMNDFRTIQGFQSWVYKANELAVKWIEKNIQSTDIVVTHYAPSDQSVDDYYRGSQLNRFFVCDMEPLIRAVQPRVWFHGHVHNSFNYKIDTTKVICNPFGYVGHELNSNFIDNLKIVVDNQLGVG